MGTSETKSQSCQDACATSATQPILRLQAITIAWMLAESGVALASAWKAHSPALLAFGADSLVELMSATVVLLQFATPMRIGTARAAKIAGILLFALAGTVVIASVAALVGHVESEKSPMGIAITILALLAMPLLARAKRKAASASGNRALAADAMQSATCAYLAAITLAGLAVNAAFQIAWFDPAAALAAVPVICIEARKALRGDPCGC
jgi:divalent metal cation (Fe/Co/Zn/Cd) transporter